MKSLKIGNIENTICDYGYHKGKHCVLLTTCVSEKKQVLTLQQIHKYVDECSPKLVLIQGHTELAEDDPCNPRSFTPNILKAFLGMSKVPIHITTKGCWETNLMVDWMCLRFDRNKYPLHESVRYASEAIINVSSPEDIESWLYCADEKLSYMHTWLKEKNSHETDTYIRDYVMTETNLSLKYQSPTMQI